MLKQFGEFILKNRLNAASMALVFSFFFPLSWISTVIIGLVTLRKGPVEGLFIVFWASIANVVAFFLGFPDALLFGIVGGSIFVWVISWVLWLTASWTMVLEVTMLLGIVAIAAVHLVMPDVVAWWLSKYQTMMSKSFQDAAWLAQSFGFDNADDWNGFVSALKESNTLTILAKISTGFLTALLLVARLIKLGLARWWQAILFNPKGMREELYTVRLGYVTFIGFILVLMAAFSGWALAWDLLPVFVLAMTLAGLSLSHFLASQVKTGLIWLFVLYILLVLLTPYCITVLAGMAFIDSILDLRKRFKASVT